MCILLARLCNAEIRDYTRGRTIILRILRGLPENKTCELMYFTDCVVRAPCELSKIVLVDSTNHINCSLVLSFTLPPSLLKLPVNATATSYSVRCKAKASTLTVLFFPFSSFSLGRGKESFYLTKSTITGTTRRMAMQAWRTSRTFHR